jgi:hypothetical protein
MNSPTLATICARSRGQRPGLEQLAEGKQIQPEGRGLVRRRQRQDRDRGERGREGDVEGRRGERSPRSEPRAPAGVEGGERARPASVPRATNGRRGSRPCSR